MTEWCNLCNREPRPGEVITLTMGDPDPARRIYQCKKHPHRVGCVVPFCGRTFKSDFPCELLCGKHWRGGDKRDRALHARVIRKISRIGKTRQLVALENKLFARIKTAAIETALGIID